MGTSVYKYNNKLSLPLVTNVMIYVCGERRTDKEVYFRHFNHSLSCVAEQWMKKSEERYLS